MRDSQGMQDDLLNQPIMEGTAVHDVNGNKIGEVSEHGVQRNALVVHKGMFRKDLYVPMSALSGRDDRGIHLNVAKEDINGLGWDNPPTAEAPMAGAAPTRAATATTHTANTVDDVEVPLREEQLVVDKQPQQIGDVHLHRGVTEERQTVQTPTSHEEVYVERRPDGALPIGEDAFTDKDIDMPVMGEQVTAGKEAHVVEDVHLRKQRVTDQQQVSDTVRREHLDIEGKPDGVIDARDRLDDTEDSPLEDR